MKRNNIFFLIKLILVLFGTYFNIIHNIYKQRYILELAMLIYTTYFSSTVAEAHGLRVITEFVSLDQPVWRRLVEFG